MHEAFDETCKSAESRGLRVTGSELVGLVPKKVLIDAADFFLEKQERSLGISEEEKMKIAVKSLGLDELKPFDPKEKVIEYLIEGDEKGLVDLSLTGFANQTASESPAPGGGSVAAYCGALSASLATMVANLSSHKGGWDDRWKEFSDYAERGEALKNQLLDLVDRDTNAFNLIMEAFGLPKSNEEEKAKRSEAIQEATKVAINTPLETMKVSLESMNLCWDMVQHGNPNSITDGAVGALAARAGVIGAELNVKINLGDLKDQEFKEAVLKESSAIRKESEELEKQILALTESQI